MGRSFKENKQNFNDLKLETIGEHCFAGVCFVPRSFAFFIKLGVFFKTQHRFKVSVACNIRQ